jgi:molybdopterin/thiamine biosynthesis adenylyltransferase
MCPEENLRPLLKSAALKKTFPDGVEYESISEDDLVAVAKQCGLSLREVQSAALAAEIRPERYVRNFRRFSAAEQKMLLDSRVFLVGLGGLGGSVLESLLRAGVGKILAADGDSFEESNLNRQALSSMEYLNKDKAEAAKARAEALNPAVEFRALSSFLDKAAMLRHAASCEVVIDALGGLRDRLSLQKAAAEAGKPLVTAAVAGLTGWAAVVMPGERGPFDFFPPEAHDADAQNGLGCPAPTVATAAALQASEAMHLLMGKKAALAGKMLLFDLTDMSFDTITLGS